FTKIHSVDLPQSERATNPSGEVALASNTWPLLRGVYKDGQINTGRVQGIVYDVAFGAGDGALAEGLSGSTTAASTAPGAPDLLERDLLRIRPDVVISMGFAPDASFRLEQDAYDEDEAVADNRGFRPTQGRREFPGDPLVLHTSLPFKAIERGWSSMGIKYRESRNAGRYVCNDVFYRLMRVANGGRSNGTRILKAGFIHVPDPNLVDQRTVNDAIKCAVERTLSDIDPATYEDVPATTTLLRHG
ncbi:MAG TPA: hypothetical protein VHB21_12080, partial [Minicystis sp.]|nr:hypothetical protein [Minicystis sp.]